ncbi:DUF3408 domain-containing protein [Hymenobacter sp. BT188]|uniref:DUF3408 domain-containing protein n=1 Tax=Hymenobacter sp. BT188 TaxID=2763504 RepID=UPI0016514BDD|nr:DUF3408 domain-containing protein [Hymenobacter sp. BT188]MBC6609239.1 DUF3408 domain-containing protein [Hymenobacter sp. BT188]
MAKSTAPDVNAFVSSFARNRQPAAPETDSAPESEPAMQALPAADSAPEIAPAASSLKVERTEEPERKGRKETAPAEQGVRADYAETFLYRGREKKNKAVYITEDAHRTLSAIIQASDNTPLADLLANIITHHFETFGPDIRAFLAEQEKKNKKRLLI